MKNLALIVLAAGSSSRMRGSHKLLLPVQDEPLIAKSFRSFADVPFIQKVVVVGHQAESIEKAIVRVTCEPLSVQFVRNENHASGMRSSLQAGIRALRDEVGGVLIALADQPFISSETVLKLANAFEDASQEQRPSSPRLFAPYANGKRGNPVIVARSLFREILSETSSEGADQGARFLFIKYPEAVELIEIESASIHDDIDTPEDYLKFCKKPAGPGARP